MHDQYTIADLIFFYQWEKIPSYIKVTRVISIVLATIKIAMLEHYNIKNNLIHHT